MSDEQKFKEVILREFGMEHAGPEGRDGSEYALSRLYRIVLGRPYDRDDNVCNAWAHELLAMLEREYPGKCAIQWRMCVLAETIVSRNMTLERFDLYSRGQKETIEMIQAEIDHGGYK